MAWDNASHWWGRNRASRMSCEQAKAHACQVPPRQWLIGADACVHAVGSEAALCGAALVNPGPLATGMVFEWCDECAAIVREVDALAGGK